MRAGPTSVTWSYLGDGNNRLETVNDGTRNLVQISYDNTTNNRPSVLLNADDLSARSGSPDPNLNPSYSTSHEIDISYASTGNQVCQISQPHITGQTPTTTSTWQFSYSGGGCASPPSSCPTSNRANAHGSLGATDSWPAAGCTSITPPCQEAGSAVCANRTGSQHVEVFYDNYGQEMELDRPARPQHA